MRTILVALAIGVFVMSSHARRLAKAEDAAKPGHRLESRSCYFLLGFGAFVVYRTRAQNALSLQDPSSSLRVQVARVGASRIMLHPLFGHGMDCGARPLEGVGLPWNRHASSAFDAAAIGL